MLKIEGLSLAKRVVQVKGNIVSDMGGEKVMLSIESGKYYNLGEIGGRIWELLAQPALLAEVVDTLTAEYEVDRSECEQHVISFAEMLLQEGLIESGEDHGDSK